MPEKDHTSVGGEVRQLWEKGYDTLEKKNYDYAMVLLAEALDVVAAMAFAIPETAASLGCTTSQIVKFLRAEPQALSWVNRQRAQRNMPRLR